MRQLVMTAVGPDRPGLVGQLTGTLHKAGGNVADSRMVNLRGQFALLVLVEGDEAALPAMRQAFEAAAKALGLTMSVTTQGPAAQAVRGVPYHLKTYSPDQPGIVAKISELLRQHGVNIEELSTRLQSAPFTGEPLFTMDIDMTVPSNVPVRKLRQELETLCDGLNADVDLEPA